MVSTLIPDHLAPVLAVLRRAYPAGVPTEDYLPLLALLQIYMSYENLAIVVSELVDDERVVVENDAAKASSSRRPSIDEVERIRRHLVDSGWTPDLPDP